MKVINIICFIVLLIFFLPSVLAQTWPITYGEGLNAVGRYVCNDYDKGFLILADLDYKYSWIIKTDINGSILWDKKIGDGVSTIWSRNIERTIDNGIIACGSWTKTSNSFDAYIIKYDRCAEVEWCKALTTPNNYDMGLKIKQTPQGDYILLGGYFNTVPASNTSIFKFDSQGNLIWQQFYPLDSLTFGDETRDLLVDSDGYLITSFCYYPDPGTTEPAILRSHFLKTDTAGNKLWDLTYGINNYYYSLPWNTIKDSESNYYNSCTHFTNTGENPAVIKINHDGTPLFDYDIITTSNSNACGLSISSMLNDTNIVLFGSLVLDNVRKDFAVKTDATGQMIDINPLTSTTASFVSSTKSLDNKFIAIANDAPTVNCRIIAVKVNSDLEYDSIYTEPFTYDSLCPHPILSNTIDPTCDNVIVNVDEPFKKPETTQLKAYPNPADNHLTIELPKYLVVTNYSGNIPVTTIYHQWNSALIEVFDIKGEVVLERKVNKSSDPIHFDISHLNPGVYIVRLIYNNQVVGNTKVVVE